MSQPTAAEPTSRTVPAAPSAEPKPGLHPALLGAVSGLLLALAFEPTGAWWLAWVALVPFLRLVRSERPARSVFLGSWVGGLVFWLIAVEWVRASDPSAWPGWLALALVLSLWWPVALGLMRLMVRRLGVPLMIAAPAAWIAVEFVRGLYPLNGFQWFFLSHSTASLTPLIQVADLTGAWGLSLLVMLVNAWLAELIERPRWIQTPSGRRPARGQVIRTALVVVALASSLIYGAVRLSQAEFQPGPKVALIQSDIPQIFGGGPDPAEVLARFGRLVDQAATEQPNLIVLPETMFPYGWIAIDPDLPRAEYEAQLDRYSPGSDPDHWSHVGGEVRDMLHRWTDRINTPMIVGINSYFFQPGGLARYNTALLLQPQTTETQTYHKLHLVPFGEYIPWVKTIPWVLALTPFSADHMPSLDPGPKPSTLNLGPWRFGTPICFEDSVPHVARRLAAAPNGHPTDILLNLSNDGWFRGTAAHQLHLASSILRAVELRMPVARSVNTGTSALIDGNGTVLAALDPPARDALPNAAEGVLTVEVPLDNRTSLYMKTGDWLPIACLGLCLASLPIAAGRSLLTRRLHNA
ncbi:apolipoprotein N-acyltransferase [Tautonia marina]|uniref:apolipoprotein N-acyltransferase n=1 Tax=Tautonia marina TaxID=2653855 RepID=UPI001260C59C|nr:apolipoprotein N-acyltransferase [Tautonia marina]